MVSIIGVPERAMRDVTRARCTLKSRVLLPATELTTSD